ncbi:MAG: hypothetical protein ACRD3S_18220 [Terracidiphilus sp.]
MRRYHRLSFAFLLVPLLWVFMAGCSAEVGYRSYDPYYHDYHVWSDAEGPYYNAWIVDTGHRHVDYRHLGRHDREQYWRWRHDHNDRR